MKKLYKILPFICLLPLFAGCGEKENTENRLGVTFAPVDTPKSYMHLNYNCWSPNNEAKLNINGTPCTLNINNNADEMVWVDLNGITGTGNGNRNYRCFYPADAYDHYESQANSIAFIVPKDLSYTTEIVNGRNVQSIFPPMLGTTTIASGQTGYIALRHLGGLLEFRIKAGENCTGVLNSINLHSSLKLSGNANASIAAGAYNPSEFNDINMVVGENFNSTTIATDGDYMQIYIPFREFVDGDNAAYQAWFDRQNIIIRAIIWLFGGAPDREELNSRDITITINATINGNDHIYTFTSGGSSNGTKPSVAVNQLVQMSKIQLTETQVLDESGNVMSGWTVQ